MAKRVSRRAHNELVIHKWWANLILGLAFLAVAYGTTSLAINSGNLLEYALTIIFLVWAINRFIVGIKHVFDR